MRSKNTELMTKMIDFIDNFYLENGTTPTFREIASNFNITSACVSHYVTDMKAKGLIQSSSKSRSIKTTKMSSRLNKVDYLPVVGTIACGTPILAEENIEKYLPFPTDFLGLGKYFILKAKGDSMINAGIEEGDYVIVKQQDSAEVGEIVVALIDNDATLKRYYFDNKKKLIKLHPENDTMEDMYFNNNIVIQGVAVKVIKDLK